MKIIENTPEYLWIRQDNRGVAGVLILISFGLIFCGWYVGLGALAGLIFLLSGIALIAITLFIPELWVECKFNRSQHTGVIIWRYLLFTKTHIVSLLDIECVEFCTYLGEDAEKSLSFGTQLLLNTGEAVSITPNNGLNRQHKHQLALSISEFLQVPVKTSVIS